MVSRQKNRFCGNSISNFGKYLLVGLFIATFSFVPGALAGNIQPFKPAEVVAILAVLYLIIYVSSLVIKILFFVSLKKFGVVYKGAVNQLFWINAITTLYIIVYLYANLYNIGWDIWSLALNFIHATTLIGLVEGTLCWKKLKTDFKSLIATCVLMNFFTYGLLLTLYVVVLSWFI